MSYDSVILADTPIHYWKCGEASGTLADTGTTAGWDLNIGGVTTYGIASMLPSDAATAVGFINFANQYKQTNLANATIPSPMSIELWYRPNAGGHSNSGIIGAWNGSAQGTMLAMGGSNDLRFYTDGTFLACGNLSSGTVYHIVATWDGTNRRCYLNGSLAAGPTAGSTPTASPGLGWEINGYQGNNFYTAGDYQKVALYNYALSAGQVTAHYNAGTTPPALGRSYAVII